MVVVCLCHVPAFNIWSTAKFFLNRRDGAIPQASRALGGGPGNRSPRELVRPRYRLPEPEGNRVLGDLLRVTSCGDEQLLTSRTMCSGTVQVTPDRPHLGFVLAFRTAGTVKPSNRGAEEEGSCVLATKPATKVKETSLQSLEGEIRCERAWSSPIRLAEARANRKSVFWARKRSSDVRRGSYGARVKL